MAVVLEKAKRNPHSLKHRCTGKGNQGMGCGALLQLDFADLRFFTGTDYPIYRPDAVLFRCPECGSLTDIVESKWPSGFRQLTRFTRAWADGAEPPPPLPHGGE